MKKWIAVLVIALIFEGIACFYIGRNSVKPEIVTHVVTKERKIEVPKYIDRIVKVPEIREKIVMTYRLNEKIINKYLEKKEKMVMGKAELAELKNEIEILQYQIRELIEGRQ